MRVLILAHRRLVPPLGFQPRKKVQNAKWRTEYDVREALVRLGHETEIVGLENSLQPLNRLLGRWQPDVVFNLLEEFDGEALFDHNVVSLLELLNLTYTGCNARGMALARDKATAKKIVAYHGVTTPSFFVVSRQQKAIQVPEGIRFPLIVKYLTEEASLGLGPDNVVADRRELRGQVARMLDRLDADLLVEEYIEGREIYVGTLGNDLLEILPARELHFGRLPSRLARIASGKVKWSPAYRRRYGIYTRTVNANEKALLRRLRETTQAVCQALRINGYCRIDYRIDERGQIHFVEANPNPQICMGEDFADSAQSAGWGYDELIQRIVDLARNWKPNRPVSL